MNRHAYLALLMSILMSGPAMALSVHSQTETLAIANVCDGTWSDFKWQWSGYDDQSCRLNYDTSLAGWSVAFRITSPMNGTIYLDVPATDITVASTSVTWNIAVSNIPPAGSYWGEALAYVADGGATSYVSIAQGRINVTWSLYNNASNYFQRTTTNVSVGQVYVHPNWINPPWVQTNATDIAPLGLVVTNEIARALAAEGLLQTNHDALGVIVSNLTFYTNASEVNVELTPTNYSTGTASVEGHLIGVDQTLANLTTATGAIATLQAQVAALSVTNNILRYAAMTNSGEEIYVLATGTNVTAARDGTTITVTIPAGVRVCAMRVRWDGGNGAAFTLKMGTTDMANTGLADRWNAIFQAYNETTGALISGASCRLDTSNHDELEIMGLPTTATSHCRFGF
jgi:hypothetical protein